MSDIRPRVRLTKRHKEVLEGSRDLVKYVEDVTDDEHDRAYARGVVDALAFVWAGMPEDAAKVYAGTNSKFAELMKQAGL